MKIKGQLTIFIIMGIILVVSVVLYFVLRGGIIQEYSISDTSSVKNFVDDCILEVSENVLEQVSQRGGYYFFSNKSTSSGLAIYYSNGNNYMPSKEEIEEEISFYVKESLFFCTKNFIDFSGLNVSQGEVEVKTFIEDESISFEIDYPIRVMRGDNLDLLRDFSLNLPVRVKVVYEMSKEILQSSRDEICLSCILDKSLEKDLYVDVNDLSDEAVMFIVRDENSELKEGPFEWVFVIDYA
ncbi:MAG: hypothetical protein OQK82_00740 [Candidatus Pacearchaeota archaeon]|nr:hypothetical protein [Candidatus Pacearchaeota archaeon]